MGWFDRLRGRESFAQWNAADPAFAAWLRGSDDPSEVVTQYTILGLSAVIRATWIIATTIASLPLRSYERQGEERVRFPSDFDDPYPGPDGLTPFAWTETVLMHLLLWRHAFLWHEKRADGTAGFAYRPIIPEAITKIYRDENGRRRFEYRTKTPDGLNETQTVGSEQITYIPGPSLDGIVGHPFVQAARAVFSAAISGDRTAQALLARSIRIGGIVSPGEGEDDFDPTEAQAILEGLRTKLMGPDKAGDLAVINRKVKLAPFQMNNIESQWHETRMDVLMQVEQLFGVPPHLMADTERQTSWGTGVAEQNLGLQRYTLMGWSSRIEQVLSMRLDRDQFCEYDYKGLLQGTPADEIRLLIEQVKAGLLLPDEARKVMNLPPLTPAQRAQQALRAMPQPVADEVAA